MSELCKSAYSDVDQIEAEKLERRATRKVKNAKRAQEAILKALGIDLDPHLIEWNDDEYWERGSFEVEDRLFWVSVPRGIVFAGGEDLQVTTMVPYSSFNYRWVDTGKKTFFLGKPKLEERQVPTTLEREVTISRPADLIHYEVC